MQNGGSIFGRPPKLNLEIEKRNQQLLLKAIRANLVKSAHDVSEGGLAVCLAECLMSAESLGAQIDTAAADSTALLFSESQSRFVISVADGDKAAFEALTGAALLGRVTDTSRLEMNVNGTETLTLSVEDLSARWKGAIECLLK
jgi:phosphoribosylformylglycinamidine synthase